MPTWMLFSLLRDSTLKVKPSVCLSACLSVCLSACLPIRLSCLSVFPSVFPSLSLSFSVFSSVFPSLSVFLVWLSVRLPVCLPQCDQRRRSTCWLPVITDLGNLTKLTDCWRLTAAPRRRFDSCWRSAALNSASKKTHTHTERDRPFLSLNLSVCLSGLLKGSRFWLVGCWTNRRVRMTSSQSLETPPPSRSRYWDTFTGKRPVCCAQRAAGLWGVPAADPLLFLSSKTDRAAKGAECFQRSLTLNPFLWSPFQNLCHLGNARTHTHFPFDMWLCDLRKCFAGEKPDPDQVFRLSALQNSSLVPPPPHISPAQNPSHRLDTALMETPQDTLVHKPMLKHVIRLQ